MPTGDLWEAGVLRRMGVLKFPVGAAGCHRALQQIQQLKIGFINGKVGAGRIYAPIDLRSSCMRVLCLKEALYF